VDGDVLAEDVEVADFHRGRLAVVLEVLRTLAEDGAGVDLVAAAHRQRAAQVDAGAQDAVGADADVPLDDDVRPDLDAGAEFGLGRDDRRGMDASCFRVGHDRTRSREDPGKREKPGGRERPAAPWPQLAPCPGRVLIYAMAGGDARAVCSGQWSVKTTFFSDH